MAPQGLYATETEGLTIEECVFDHNGFIKDSEMTGFRHHIYLWEAKNTVIRNNVFSRESYLAVKVRSDHTDGGKNLSIRDNVFFETKRAIWIGGDPLDGDPKGAGPR